MPTTTMTCMSSCRKAVWGNWTTSGRFPGQGFEYTPFSESLFRSVTYRPGWPPACYLPPKNRRASGSQSHHWYNHQHRHSGIKFVTLLQRHDRQPCRSVAIALSFKYQSDSTIGGDDHDQPGACGNRKWFGSFSCQMSSMNKGR